MWLWVVLFLIFGGLSILFSVVAASIYNTTKSTPGLPFFHIPYFQIITLEEVIKAHGGLEHLLREITMEKGKRGI